MKKLIAAVLFCSIMLFSVNMPYAGNNEQLAQNKEISRDKIKIVRLSKKDFINRYGHNNGIPPYRCGSNQTFRTFYTQKPRMQRLKNHVAKLISAIYTHHFQTRISVIKQLIQYFSKLQAAGRTYLRPISPATLEFFIRPLIQTQLIM
jgi:hypothetical protein